MGSRAQDGRFAYFSGFASKIAGFAVDPTSGALTPIAGSPFSGAADPQCLRVVPGQKFLIAGNVGPGNVSVFSIDANSGALTAVPGSPFGAAGPVTSLDIVGSFVYAPDALSNIVTGFNLDTTSGALSIMTGSPFTFTNGVTGIGHLGFP